MGLTLYSKSEDAHEDEVWTCCWRGGKLFTGAVDGVVHVWDGEPSDHPRRIKSLEGHRLGVLSVDVSPDQKHIVSASLDSNIIVWSGENYEEVQNINAGAFESWMAKCADNDHLVSCSHKGLLTITKMATGETLGQIECKRLFLSCLGFGTKGSSKVIACGDEKGGVHVLDFKARKRLHSFNSHTAMVRSVSLSPSKNLLASGADDKKVILRDIRTQAHVATLSGHRSWVLCSKFDKQGQTLASGSADSSIKHWDLRALKEPKETLNSHVGCVWDLDFDDSGKQLASTGEDRTLRIFDLK